MQFRMRVSKEISSHTNITSVIELKVSTCQLVSLFVCLFGNVIISLHSF